ncbi:hypothetical protein [Haloarcula sp. CBA1127]|uniref:hypothetical protein n=1 Tax=Haloarcula sp. CBA1127 TaxID=1765055 RepID=UPI0009ABBDB6|nr:hypothetical protein [Haloarcula sp. CBA1127]
MSAIEDARETNKNSLQKQTIDTTDLNGAQLPRDLYERFIERQQRDAELLSMVRVEDLPRLEMGVPKIGVPELSGDVRAEGGEDATGTSDAATGSVEFNATDQSYYIQYDLKRDSVKNAITNEDSVAEVILSHFEKAWGNDVQNIGINAGRSGSGLPATFNDTFDGWISIAEGNDTDSTRIGTGEEADASTMPSYDHADGGGSAQPVNTTLFNNMIQTVPERYRDPDDLVFLTSKSQVQSYAYRLTEREDALGVAALLGDNDVTPFEYDVMGVSYWPDDAMMLVNPQNLAYGLFTEVEMTQLTNTDKTMERRLHSRNLIEGQFDYQIEELQAGALGTNIAAPSLA